MISEPKLRLFRLRDIGWKYWDPIGLGSGDGIWPQGCSDEYDGYLTSAAGHLRRTGDKEAAIQMLVDAETERMGMPYSAEAGQRAAITVEAIIADAQLWTEN